MATAAIIGGTALSAMGSQYQGMATQAAYNAQAKLATAESQYQERLGEIQANQYNKQVRQVQGKQMVAGAVSGLDTSSGSFLDIIGDTAKQASINTQLIKYNAQIASQKAASQANIYAASGENAMTAANINTFSTLLSGTGASAMSYSKYGWGL